MAKEESLELENTEAPKSKKALYFYWSGGFSSSAYCRCPVVFPW